MATPLTPDQLLAAAQSTGMPVIELPGWRGRCRCHTGSHEAGGTMVRPYGGINGVTMHITGGPANSGQAGVDYANGILAQGRSDLPGPLCQFSIDADGRVIIVAAGRSNHIGSISQAGLDTMIGASFSLDGYQDLRGHGVDGNTHTYGMEMQQPGTPTDVQRSTAVKLAAALCAAHGWTGQETHGHGEVSDQRSFSDPGLDMGAVRRDVMALVQSGVSGSGTGGGGGLPTGNVPPPPPPAPPALPTVRLSHVLAAIPMDRAGATGVVHYGDPAGAVALERALASALRKLGVTYPGPIDGSLGDNFVKYYAIWQRHCGAIGPGADGIPGWETFSRLAREEPFFIAARY